MKFKAVIFDFGGVFVQSPVLNFAKFERAHDLPDKFIGGVIKSNLHKGAFARFERSEISVDEFDGLFAEETRQAGFEISGRKLLSMLHQLEFHETMIIALKTVQGAGLKTGCITNNMPGDAMGWENDDDYQERIHKIIGSFDHVIESSKAGVRKPEPKIYEMMCEAINIAPEQCIFLDDLGVNLKPAQVMGMETIRVPFGDVQPAVDALAYATGLKF